MNFYQGLAVVLLRVLAAIVLYDAVTSSVFLLLAVIGPSPYEPPLSTFSMIGETVLYGAQLSIGYSLWFFAPGVAKHVVSGVSAPKPAINVDKASIIEIGVFLIGLFYLVGVIPDLLVKAGRVFIEAANQTDDERLYGTRIFRLAEATATFQEFAKAAVALFLIFRASDFAKIFSWLRGAGVPPTEEVAPSEPKPAPGE